jgi:hypothetical protein
MNPLDEITLAAFLLALAHLDSPLLPTVQDKLITLSDSLAENVNKLDDIAAEDLYLNALYQDIREVLQEDASELSKTPIPDPDYNAEEHIIKIAQSVFKADSSNAARQVAKSGILKRLSDLFKNSQA